MASIVSMVTPIAAIEAALHGAIPITRALGLRVAAWDADGLALAAPLAPNRNDKGTVFAGSLNAALTLAGWGLLWLALREHGRAATVIIQDSSIEYLRPVADDFVARCARPAPGELERLLATLERRGRARIELAGAVLAAGQPAVVFRGRYVVQQ